MHSGHHSDFGKALEPIMSAPPDASKSELTSPVSADGKDDSSRGRRRTRGNEGDEGDAENADAGADGQDVGGSSRKRRRSRKGLDRKFECPHEGCGKSYSRAEHLYRHQLNRELLTRTSRCGLASYCHHRGAGPWASSLAWPGLRSSRVLAREELVS